MLGYAKLQEGKPYGPQLRKLRENQKITQTELSKRMGCHTSNVSHFEMGDNTRGSGSMKTVLQYVKALGLLGAVIRVR